MSAITYRVAGEIIGHEGLVREAYKDSTGVWTWSIGVTNASGHQVYPRYKDNPQSIRRCLEVFVWLLDTRYAPAVRAAFAPYDLTESQFAAALSFHYNTDAIGKADWVRMRLAGDKAGARAAFMNWRRPAEIIPRREAERDLFFDGKWTWDGLAAVYPVRKPAYTPAWGKAERVDVSADLRDLLP